jgi:CheY-like chemotaxis protein
MSFVLAVEPDDAQAKLLRGLVSGPDTELVVVASPKAALDALARQTPDLVLLSESLGFKKQAIVDRLRSMPAAAKTQTLTIPSLHLTDPEAFAAEVMLCLLNGAAPDRTDEPKTAAIAAELHEAHIALLQADAEARLASELDRVRREASEQRTAELARLEAEAEERRRADVAAARAAAAEEARHSLTSELAGIRGEAEDMLASELARVRDEAAQKLAAQLQEADVQRAAAVEQARIAAEQAASRASDSCRTRSTSAARDASASCCV